MKGCQASASLIAPAVGGQAPTSGTDTLVSDVMLRHPKTLPAWASAEDARSVLANDHVHMVLLTDGSTLVGTLMRTDLPPTAQVSGPALLWSTLHHRTVPPSARADVVRDDLVQRGQRRVAVVDHDGSLLGLMCLKRSRTGFCADDDTRSRAQSRRATD